MIKKLLLTAAATGMLCNLAYAADETKVGVGVGITDGCGGNGGTTVRAPINLSNELRIEPEISLNYSSGDHKDTTNLGVGTGLYLLNHPSSKINLYYGGKILIRYHKDKERGQTNSNTEFAFGGTFGFEYLFDRHFSAGGEAGAYLGFGDMTIFTTQGLALLRYYF